MEIVFAYKNFFSREKTMYCMKVNYLAPWTWMNQPLQCGLEDFSDNAI